MERFRLKPLLRRLGTLALGLSLWFAPMAYASNPTISAAPAIEAAPELPGVPAGWDRVPGATVEVYGSPAALPTLVELSRHAHARLPELSGQLGVPVGGKITVYVASSDEEFRALQPARAPMWADGVAYPSLGYILLRENDLRGGMAKPLSTVLDHELVHILLGRAFAPNIPPSWLQEGFAQIFAGEQDLQQIATLSRGSVTGVLPLDELTQGFPRDPIKAQLAYAESADFIGWLQTTYGPETLPKIVDQMARGATVEAALYRVTGDMPEHIDEQWRARLESPFGLSFGAIAQGEWVLGVGGLALLVGGLMRRRMFHRRLAEMEAEEQLLDQLLADLRARQGLPPGGVWPKVHPSQLP